MNKGEKQAQTDAANENKRLIDERKAYQKDHWHWTKS